MKDIAKYLPGIGWSFIFMEYPLLKRDWNKDKARLAAACKNLADYPVNMLVSNSSEPLIRDPPIRDPPIRDPPIRDPLIRDPLKGPSKKRRASEFAMLSFPIAIKRTTSL